MSATSWWAFSDRVGRALPGIEVAQAEYYAGGPILTVELIPTEIGGSIIYTPQRVEG